MRKLFNVLLATATCVFASSGLIADADIDIEDLSSKKIDEESSGGPFTASISGDYIGRADFECKRYTNFKFATADIDLSFIYYYNPCLKEGASVGVSYLRTRLDWKYNPFFTQKDIDTVSLNLACFSQRLKDWTWRAQLSVNFDNIEYWHLQNYMNYDILLWGRYDYAPNIGVHLGILALTGMKIDRVYPIIGIDWTYNCHWKLNLVFPMDISLVYTINKCWTASLAGRFINQRHRVKKQQFYSEGIWFYTSSGAEFAIDYKPAKWISANIHAGVDFGGHLKVANRHYRDGHRLRFNSAPYAGAEVDMNF
ncbi:MAG TPA: hypothetical protein VGP47_08170 [Parachlamydiaceae bacterium]|nr:hypothetical protein [Parachlamydiaceae bacterium]